MFDPNIKVRPYWDVKSISQINSPEEVAKEFEAIFVRMILKEFRKSLDGGIFSNSFSYKMFTDMFDMQIAQVISSSDKLGLKQYIMNALKTYQKYSGE